MEIQEKKEEIEKAEKHLEKLRKASADEDGKIQEISRQRSDIQNDLRILIEELQAAKKEIDFQRENMKSENLIIKSQVWENSPMY